MRTALRPPVTTRWLWIAGLAFGLLFGSQAQAQTPKPSAVPQLEVQSSQPPPAASVKAAPLDTGSGHGPAASSSATTEPPKRPPTSFNGGLGRAPEDVLRDTPRETVSGFLSATRLGDFEKAAHYLYLSHFPANLQKTQGPVLARELANVLDRTVWFDLEAVSDDPGPASAKDGPVKDVQVASVPMPGGNQGVRLTRVQDPRSGATPIWVFSPSTVQAIDRMYDVYGLPPLVQKLPPWMREFRLWGVQLWQWAGLIPLGLVSWLVGYLSELLTLFMLGRAVRRAQVNRPEAILGLAKGIVRRFWFLVVFLILLPYLALPVSASNTAERLLYIGIIYVVMRGAIRLVSFGAQAILEHRANGSETDDDTRVRTIATRVTAIRRIAMVLIFVVGIALALVQFPEVRSVGISLLGSAGLAGAILGFAAQKTFANLFAGILISFTQPIRIGDIVVVEKEWGVIEEIGATHVVVRCWDLRRLVLPVSYFLDQPFENWTKKSNDLLGVVFVQADYTVKRQALEAELNAMLENEPLWNGKAKEVIVSDLTDRTVQFRVLVSANNSGDLFNLRCKVRERMLSYLQNDPSRLPKWRVLDDAKRAQLPA